MDYLSFTLPVSLPGLVSTNPADSPHMPLPQTAIPPEVPGLNDLSPERVGTDFGMETSFKLVPDDYNVLKSVILMVKLDALANTGPFTPNPSATPPTYGARYPSDVLCHAIDVIQWQVGGLVVQEIEGDKIHFRQAIELGEEDYARVSEAQKIVDFAGDRATLATVPQWVMLEIPLWWTETAAKHWHQYCCQRQTRIIIKWRHSDYIIQTDNPAKVKPLPATGATSPYIMDMFLRFRVSALDTAVKETYTNAVKSQGGNGLNYLLKFSQKQERQLVPATATKASIQLTNFNKPTNFVWYVCRNEEDLQPDVSKNNRWNLQETSWHYLDASGHKLWPRTSNEYNKLEVNSKYFLNTRTGRPSIYHFLHTDYPDATQYPMGCIEYGKLQNPTVFLEWTSALSKNMLVDVYAECYDYVRLVVTSDNRSAVSLEQPI